VRAGHDPAYLTIDRRDGYVYVLNEDSTGTVRAFNLDAESGRLNLINVVTTGYADPCYCSVMPEEAVLLVSYYVGAAVSVFPLKDSGAVAEPSCTIEHNGSSQNPERQQQAHPHAIVPSPNHQFVYVPDLGTDEIVIYEFEPARRALTRLKAVDVPPGSGPRHFTFHPIDDYAYLTNELASTVTVFEWDDRTGGLDPIQSIDTLTRDIRNTAADIHVHPSGDFVYASNRGHDSIAVYDRGPDGSLRMVETQSTKGEHPRNFAIDPSGQYIYAENKLSNTIVTFQIDPETGRLTDAGEEFSVPRPACLKFL